VVDRIGGLDPAAVAAVVEEAQPDLRDADELHDLLLDLGVLPEALGRERGFAELWDALVVAGRAARFEAGPGVVHWVAAERRSLATAVWPGARFEPDVAEPAARRAPAWSEREGALGEIVRGHLPLLGPTTGPAIAARLALSSADIEPALARLEMDGGVLRGRFLPELPDETQQWCERRLLARINRRMLDGLRREIEPVSAADFLRFLFGWQAVRPGSQLHGQPGLARVIAQLQGFEAAAGAWERDIFPARIAGYDSAWLDALCLSGGVAWGRLEARPAGGTPSRAALIAIARRADLPWLLEPRAAGEDGATLSAPARDVLAFLARAGASFQDEIVTGTRRLRAEVEDGLGELVSAGRVTGDGFSGLRALISASSVRGGSRARWHARWSRRTGGAVGAGRWSLLGAPGVDAPKDGDRADSADARLAEESRHEMFARQYIKRYGVVFRDLLARESHAPAWRDLLRVYRRLEMSGELRGGRLVAGFVGEQFAAPEALEALRATRREEKRGELVRVSACDPLNLIGIITPGPRVQATLANSVVYRDGVPQVGGAEKLERDRPADQVLDGISA
jgi:ATP-dependent Lhr-like helicase